MKRMNYEEFQNRVNEVNKAYRIFKPLTNNMTEAFRLYQEVLAEEEMAVFISTAAGSRPPTLLDNFERPKCPECTLDLRLKVGVKDENEKEWNTAWFCEKCLAEFYSDKTVQEWMSELRKRDVQEQ